MTGGYSELSDLVLYGFFVLPLGNLTEMVGMEGIQHLVAKCHPLFPFHKHPYN